MPSPRTLRASNRFTPTNVSGLALWLDASQSGDLYTTDAGPVTAVSAPTDISGCALWLDGADSSAASMTLSGSLVGTWKDKSGNGRDATASGTTRPTLSSNALNGNSVVTFDGVDDTMLTTDFTVAQPHTILVVGRRAVGGVNQNFVDGGTAGRAAIYWANTDNWGMYAGSAATGPTGTDTNWHVFGAVFNGASSLLGLDGSAISTSNPGTGSCTGLRIGAYSASLALLNGAIAEIIAFNTALSTTDRARVERYLAVKWGLSRVHANATTASDPVGYWRDRSGNNRHATQSTAANRPTVSAATQNSRRQVELPSTTGNCLAAQDLSLAAPYSLFAVVSSSARRIGTFFGSGTSTNTQYGDGTATYSGAYYGASRVGGVVYGSAPIATGRGQIFAAVAASGTLPSSLSMWADGIGGTAAVVYASATVPNNTVGGPLQIGANQTSSWGGTVCEALAYSRALTTAERQRVERYLAAKWGIALAPQVSNADAQDWINRVYINGGTVLPATAAAVNQFCADIDAAGLRSLMYRANLFAGTGLNAALVPLYRGPSLGGTQYGNTTDTNVGPFVSGDYAETGASGGLLGNATSKYLNTGFPTNTVAEGNRHIAAYEIAKSPNTYDTSIGSEGASANTQQFILATFNAADAYKFAFGSASSSISPASYSGGAMWLGVNSGSGSGVLYKNGASAATGSLAAATPTAASMYVLALNRQDTAADLSAARLGSYSIGLSMTATQAAAYYTAMQAFQTALGRQV